MTVPRLYGPLALTAENIDRHLQADSPGIYVLGNPVKGTFIVKRIGRSDQDLRSALKAHLRGPYLQFKFAYALSPGDAFLKECRVFHGLIVLDDLTHPTAPEGVDVKCPGCAVSRAVAD